MIPAYQNSALDGDNRAKRRVIKALDRAYANTEEVIVSGADMSEDAGSGFKALEKKLLLFISLTLEAQADIEQEGESVDTGAQIDTTYDPDNELLIPQGTDPSLSDFDDDSNIPSTINPMKRKGKPKKSQIPIPLQVKTRGATTKATRDANRMRSPERIRGRSLSPVPSAIKQAKLWGGAITYQHSGMFAGLLKNMLTCLQDISAIQIDIANSFDFLNKEQVFRLMTLLKRARSEFSSLVHTFDNLVSHKYLYNRATKQRMLEEVGESF